MSLEIENLKQQIAELNDAIKDKERTIAYMAQSRTLRDWFAGQVISGLCADYGRTTCMTEGAHANIAMIAYKVADAMLADRDKP